MNVFNTLRQLLQRCSAFACHFQIWILLPSHLQAEYVIETESTGWLALGASSQIQRRGPKIFQQMFRADNKNSQSGKIETHTHIFSIALCSILNTRLVQSTPQVIFTNPNTSHSICSIHWVSIEVCQSRPPTTFCSLRLGDWKFSDQISTATDGNSTVFSGEGGNHRHRDLWSQPYSRSFRKSFCWESPRITL